MTSLATARRLDPPPGPRLPVAAQSLLFGRYRHRWLPYLRRCYGDTYGLRIAPHNRHLVVISRPDDLRAVFAGPSTTFHAGEGNAILGPVMGQHSVLLLDEAEHLRVRRLLTPAFHGASLHGYQDLIRRLTRAEVERWPVGVPFASHRRTTALTLEIILRVVFGVTDAGRLAELRPVVERVVTISPLTILGWFYPRLRSRWPWRRFFQIQRELDRLLYAEIADRRRAPDLAERPDVLSQLLRVGARDEASRLTDAELRDNLVTLLLAGHETTATALAWAFCELAREPEVRYRAQRAADEDDRGYLEAVAKEALRLHPVIYEVARRVTADVELGGYRIPAGATVVPAIGLVQADPMHHRTPGRFDPGRFVGDQPAPNTWLPFGGGVRRCLGAGFSLLEATEVLGEVLRRFEFTADRPAPERPVPRNITLAPSRGATIRLTRRQTGADAPPS
ncbi:MAG TPA: cytochrome P450 [Jatrophihabitans sp.]|nr:cytochrome P450 [Jatrophihabitans sp.]